MRINQPKVADYSVTSEVEVPAPVGEALATSVSLLAASADADSGPRRDWSVLIEEDSSFFVPERCTALDDF